MSVQVKSQARSAEGEPIRVTCVVGNILVGKPNEAIVYAKVTKGKQVVLNAVVHAEVSGPKVHGQTHKSTFLLHDDGRGMCISPCALVNGFKQQNAVQLTISNTDLHFSASW